MDTFWGFVGAGIFALGAGGGLGLFFWGMSKLL